MDFFFDLGEGEGKGGLWLSSRDKEMKSGEGDVGLLLANGSFFSTSFQSCASRCRHIPFSPVFS